MLQGSHVLQYELCGILEHIGENLRSGHYIAYVRGPSLGGGPAFWFRMDDHVSFRVREIDFVVR